MIREDHSTVPAINLPEILHPVARYMWNLFVEATHWNIHDAAGQPIEISNSGVFPVTASFFDFLTGNIEQVVHRYQLPEGLSAFRMEEPLACCFYLVNSLHETLLAPDKTDKYGRYPYEESIQYANQLIEVNYVQEILDDLYKNLTGKKVRKQSSRLFWSHDIDYLYSAWKSDLISMYRDKSFHRFPSVVRKILTNPHRWNNIEKILQLEEEYQIRSYFFWLTEQGKRSVKEPFFIDHADYTMDQQYISTLWHKIAREGSFNGLHKSAFDINFQEELQKTPFKVTANRNHFLKMTLPDHYNQIEEAGLSFDATLGFAEHFGFRNSFGRPFQPFNLAQNRPYSFTEIPLHLMDSTHLTYLGQSLTEMADNMIRFVHENRNSCIISILLHNSSFDFKDKSNLEVWRRLFNQLRTFDCYLPG